jgi:PAS domain S-box-containing protein
MGDPDPGSVPSAFPVDRYRILGESIPGGVMVYDDQGRIVVMNGMAAELLGLSDEQVAGLVRIGTSRTAFTVDGNPIPLEDLPVPTTRRTGEPAQMVFGIDRVGAPRRWLDVRTAPLEEGGVAVTLRDATEVKQIRDLDRATIDLATVAVDASDDVGGGVLEGFLHTVGRATDADRVVYVAIDHLEGRAASTHDWSRDGSPLRRRPGGLPLDMMPQLLGTLSRRESVAVRVSTDLPEGALGVRMILEQWGIESVLVVPVLDEGSLVGFVAIGWNEAQAIPDRIVHFANVAIGMLGSLVTRERVHAELQDLNESLDDRVRARSRQLAQEQDRVQALIDAIPDLMFELDPDGVFINIHRPTGPPMVDEIPEFIGRPVTDALGADMVDAAREALGRIRQSGELQVLEYTRAFDGVDHSFECRLVPRRDGGILAVIRDVSGRVEQARTARQQSERLAFVNARLELALQSKDEFLAAVSHELRTPLAAILGLTEMLLDPDSGELSARQRDALVTVETSGQHLLHLINDLLDLGGLGGGPAAMDLADVAVAEVTRRAVEFVRPQAEERGVRLEHVDGTDGLHIRADERRVRQILLNLLDNALKFTDPGGSVGLQTWLPRPGTVAFAIWDTGIGIDPADHERVFEPFTQIDASLGRRYDGSGLGLALVTELVRAHGGTIELESRRGQGSRFVVTLPVAGPSNPPTAPAIGADPGVDVDHGGRPDPAR